MTAEINDRDKEEYNPVLATDGAGARDGGNRNTRNGGATPGRGKWPADFRAGKLIECKIQEPYQNGYLVKLPGDYIGFFESKELLERGHCQLLTYVAFSGAYNLFLLTQPIAKRAID